MRLQRKGPPECLQTRCEKIRAGLTTAERLPNQTRQPYRRTRSG
jgi:hypothetical protein